MQICYYRMTPITDSIRIQREEKKKRQKRSVKMVWIEVGSDKGQCYRYRIWLFIENEMYKYQNDTPTFIIFCVPKS